MQSAGAHRLQIGLIQSNNIFVPLQKYLCSPKSCRKLIRVNNKYILKEIITVSVFPMKRMCSAHQQTKVEGEYKIIINKLMKKN